MKRETFESFAKETPYLGWIAVVTLPECLEYLSWHSREADDTTEDRCAYAGDLVRTLRRTLPGSDPDTTPCQVTVETTEGTHVVRDLGHAFAMVCSFDPDLPLGMVHVQTRRIAAKLNTLAWKEAASLTGKAAASRSETTAESTAAIFD